MTTDGTLTIDLAGQRRVLQQSDVLTFGRAADLVIDEDNPYLHRIVGRFFWHGGSWWLENLGSFIELEVVPEGGTSTKLPASEADSTPVVHALAPPAFAVRFESNGATYELAGVVDQAQASFAGTNGVSAPDSADSADSLAGSLPDRGSLPDLPSNGSFAASGDLAPPPASGLAEPAFASPPGLPDDPVRESAGGLFADFRPPPEPMEAPVPDLPGLEDLPPPLAPASFEGPSFEGPSFEGPSFEGPSFEAPSFDASPFVLTAVEQELLAALATPWLRSPGPPGSRPLPTDADLAGDLGQPVAQVSRRLAYLCNRLTRSGVPGLQGGGDRRSALVRHAVDAGLVRAHDLS